MIFHQKWVLIFHQEMGPYIFTRKWVPSLLSAVAGGYVYFPSLQFQCRRNACDDMWFKRIGGHESLSRALQISSLLQPSVEPTADLISMEHFRVDRVRRDHL